jgi:dihydrofolate reductase
VRRPALRTLAITQNITVDGSIEMLKDWFDPKREGDVDMSDLLEEEQRQGREADALLVGRRTFEAFREYWPKQTDDRTGIAEYLNRVQKYVVSSTLADPQWENSTVLSGDPVGRVSALKQKEGREIVLTGSIELAHTMIEAGLVDEYRLFVYPTVQGGGRRLFPDGYELSRLRLVDSKAFRSGITLQRYAPA